MNRILRSERGQAMVEFARAWNVYHAVTDAARLGARSAVVADPTTTQDTVYAIVNRALARASIDTTGATATLTGWRAGTGTPATMTIQVPYRFVFLRPFLGWTNNQAAINLTSSFVMRNE